jgi:hypothetical protein
MGWANWQQNIHVRFISLYAFQSRIFADLLNELVSIFLLSGINKYATKRFLPVV